MSSHKELLTLPDPAAVVWDLDGTLVDSAADLAKALNALLYEHGQHSHSVANVRTMIGHGVAKLIERGFRGAGAPSDEARRDAMVPRFMELYTACATDTTQLVPHAREALEFFYHGGVKQGLCTNKPFSVTRQIVSALDISGYFSSIVGGDSTAARKPHPLPLQTCLEELETRPEDAVMIGDSGADVGSARAAGVRVILVPDGYTGESADSLGADFVVGSLADLPGSMPPRHPLRRSA